MLGTIAGDIIGSWYEFHAIKTKEFELFPSKSKFTDDTTLSMAIAKSIFPRYHGLRGNAYTNL